LAIEQAKLCQILHSLPSPHRDPKQTSYRPYRDPTPGNPQVSPNAYIDFPEASAFIDESERDMDHSYSLLNLLVFQTRKLKIRNLRLETSFIFAGKINQTKIHNAQKNRGGQLENE
jgi:hypothetical protein